MDILYITKALYNTVSQWYYILKYIKMLCVISTVIVAFGSTDSTDDTSHATTGSYNYIDWKSVYSLQNQVSCY